MSKTGMVFTKKIFLVILRSTTSKQTSFAHQTFLINETEHTPGRKQIFFLAPVFADTGVLYHQYTVYLTYLHTTETT